MMRASLTGHCRRSPKTQRKPTILESNPRKGQQTVFYVRQLYTLLQMLVGVATRNFMRTPKCTYIFSQYQSFALRALSAVSLLSKVCTRQIKMCTAPLYRLHKLTL